MNTILNYFGIVLIGGGIVLSVGVLLRGGGLFLDANKLPKIIALLILGILMPIGGAKLYISTFSPQQSEAVHLVGGEWKIMETK